MQPTHKLIILLAVLTIAVGISLLYLTRQSLPEEVPTQGGIHPQAPIQHTQEPTEPTLHIEPLPVFYLGTYIHPSPEKQMQAAQLLASASQRQPNLFGIIPPDQAPSEIKIALQKTATALANLSAFDLACESIVRLDRSCKDIQTDYEKIHEGFPDQKKIFPPQDGYTCETIRKAAAPALARALARKKGITDGCDSLQDPREQQVCAGLPDQCTPDPTSAPCDILQATTQAILNGKPCSDFTSGQRAYLCMAIARSDCTTSYEHMIEDYTYSEMAFSTGENGFCDLVNEPHLKAGCLSGDTNTVRKDLIRSYID